VIASQKQCAFHEKNLQGAIKKKIQDLKQKLAIFAHLYNPKITICSQKFK